MTNVALIIVLISAFMHAGWNLFSKSKNPSGSFFFIASFAAALLLSPVLIYSSNIFLDGLFPQRVWPLIILTGLFQSSYFLCLAAAYRSGEMSVVYPLARSSPAIVIVVITLFLGQGNEVTRLAIIGILLIVGGCFLVPIQRFSELRLRNYLNATCVLALFTAIGTTGYSIVDDKALNILRNTPELQELGNTHVTLIYAGLQSLSTLFWIFLYIVIRRKNRDEFKQQIKDDIKSPILAGVAIQITYLLVLIAYAYSSNVSYIVGFRQISIPLGALLGIIVLKEKAPRTKILGVSIVVVGLVLVAVF
ncbi:MAG: EamA family transporter [Lentisphaeria bacterium]|nr:EamA family transporter [Lentisphaeria bacterium]NQZ71079.1 EamA family transporter [Lentisphaeria bacterium]